MSDFREQDPMNPDAALYSEPWLVNAPPPPPPNRGEASFKAKKEGKLDIITKCDPNFTFVFYVL